MGWSFLQREHWSAAADSHERLPPLSIGYRQEDELASYQLSIWITSILRTHPHVRGDFSIRKEQWFSYNWSISMDFCEVSPAKVKDSARNRQVGCFSMLGVSSADTNTNRKACTLQDRFLCSRVVVSACLPPSQAQICDAIYRVNTFNARHV